MNPTTAFSLCEDRRVIAATGREMLAGPRASAPQTCCGIPTAKREEMTEQRRDCDTANAGAVPALHLIRVPGESAAVIRCSGDLTQATGHALERELALMGALGRPSLIVNVGRCRTIDIEGILLLIDADGRLAKKGCRLAIVTGTGPAERLLRFLGVDEIIPTYPTEEAASQAAAGL